MIEILVAMAILVILISIVAFTVSGVISGAKKKETAVRMQSMTSMLTELETATKLTKQPAKMYHGQAPGIMHEAATNGPFDIWRDGDPSDNTTVPAPAAKPAVAPGRVDEDSFKGGIDDRARSAGVLNTQLVMGLLVGMPVNRAAVDKTSSSALMTNPVADKSIPEARLGPLGTSLTTVPNPTNANDRTGALRPAIFVDAWNNPIIFVPAAGLRGIKFNEHGPTELHIINSTAAVSEEADIADYRTPGTARPFFASAGPDGDFSTGDDNVYSFED